MEEVEGALGAVRNLLVHADDLVLEDGLQGRLIVSETGHGQPPCHGQAYRCSRRALWTDASAANDKLRARVNLCSAALHRRAAPGRVWLGSHKMLHVLVRV